MSEEPDKTALEFLAEARRHLAENGERLLHCLRQLDDQQLWWRPSPSHNSIANLVLHLCGNLAQRIGSLVGGEPDTRDRPREFTERGPIAKAALTRRLEEALASADQTLADADPCGLLERKVYGGASRQFHESVVGLIMRTLVHFGGHVQEVVCLTRLQRGDRYEFLGAPPPK